MIFLLFFPFGGEGGLKEKKYGSFADRYSVGMPPL